MTEAPLVKPHKLIPRTTREIAQRLNQDRARPFCCIKCVRGIFAGRHFYVFRNQKEVIGSSTRDPMITCCIADEQAQIQPVHVLVSASEDSLSITDLSGEENGTYVKVRHIAPRILTSNQEILFEMLGSSFHDPAASDNAIPEFGGTKRHNGPQGESIVLARGAPMTEQRAFDEFLARYELNGLTKKWILATLNTIPEGSDLFDKFAKLIATDLFKAYLTQISLESQLLLHTACSELSYYLPWEDRSRPLLLKAKRTGEVLGEVTWNGAYVVPFTWRAPPPSTIKLDAVPAEKAAIDLPPWEALESSDESPRAETRPTTVESEPIEEIPDAAQTQALQPAPDDEAILEPASRNEFPSRKSMSYLFPASPQRPNVFVHPPLRRSESTDFDSRVVRVPMRWTRSVNRQTFSVPLSRNSVPDVQPVRSATLGRQTLPVMKYLPVHSWTPDTQSDVVFRSRVFRPAAADHSATPPPDSEEPVSPSKLFSPFKMFSVWMNSAGAEGGVAPPTIATSKLTASCPVQWQAPKKDQPRVQSDPPAYHLRSFPASSSPPETLNDEERFKLGGLTFWMHAHYSDPELRIATGQHPMLPTTQTIPDLCKPSIYSCEPLFRNRGLGLPLILSMLPRAFKLVDQSVQVGDDSTVSDEPFEIRVQRCKDWIRRTPEQCLLESSIPEKRDYLRLPPAFGSKYHLTIRYEQGQYQLQETFPGDSSDFASVSWPAPPLTPQERPPPSVDIIDGVWVKIRSVVDAHEVHYDDTFRIGALTFTVLRFNTGFGGLQGYRATMEDEEVVFQDLGISSHVPVSFYAVYDGHGGRDCASFLHEELHLSFLHQLRLVTGHLDVSSHVPLAVFVALYRSFVISDRSFLRLQHNRLKVSGIRNGPGSAAVVVVIVGDIILCANSGDARAVLCRDGKAVDLSVDHKPDRLDELERISRAGGYVKNRRVLGRLAVSRAFGDIEYKNVATSTPSLVIVDPEIRIVDGIGPQDEFLLLACDGLFDVYSSQDVVTQIRSRLNASAPEDQDAQRIVSSIVQEAIEARQSRDNVSAILITLPRPNE